MDWPGRSADNTRLCKPEGCTDGFVKPGARLFLACIVLVLSFSFSSRLSSSALTSPARQFSAALWIAQKGQLSRYDIDTGSEVFDSKRTYEALAIDGRHHRLWATSGKGVDIRRLDGGLIKQIPIEPRGHQTVLSTSAKSGDGWLGIGRHIAHFKKNGKFVGEDMIRESVLDIDIDVSNQRVWVATHNSIEVLDLSGRHMSRITPDQVSNIKAFEYDSFLNGLWLSGNVRRNGHGVQLNDGKHGSSNGYDHFSTVEGRDHKVEHSWGRGKQEHGAKSGGRATNQTPRTRHKDEHRGRKESNGSVSPNKLYRVSQSGQLLYEVPVHNIRFLESTPDGYLWAASNKKLFRIYAETGLVVFSIYPFDGRGDIQGISLSPGNDGIWVASNHGVGKISNDSLVVWSMRVRRKINDIAVYRDVVPPEISIVSPKGGSILGTSRPTIHVEYADDATGVNIESLSLFLDDGRLPCSCTSLIDGAECVSHVSLPEGRVELGAKVQDFAGNESRMAKTQVTVDTIAPRISMESPIDGATTEQEAIGLKGSVSEDAQVTVNGHAVHQTGLGFEGTVGLEEGGNMIQVKATDLAGNFSALTIHVTRKVGDTTPPELEVPPDRVVEATDRLTPVTLGRAAATDDRDGALLAFPSVLGPFPVGVSRVLWVATDTAGNSTRGIQLITVRDTTPPVLIPPPHVSTESSGPAAIDIGEAEATDIFGPAIITNDAPAEFPLGSTVVTWKARDRNGNSVTETQTVTVEDENDGTRKNGWQEAELLEFDDIGDVLDPVVARSDAGDAVAVWAQEDETGIFNIMARNFSSALGWSQSELVENIDDNLALTPNRHTDLDVDINLRGEGVAIWSFEHEGYFYNTFDAAAEWNAARPLSMTDLGVQVDLEDIQHISNGSFIAVWRAYQSDGSANLVVRRFSAQAGWDPPVSLESNDPNVYSRLAKIATNSAGDALIVWERREHKNPDFPTFGSISHGTWSSTFDLTDGWSDPVGLDIFTPDSHIVSNGPYFLDAVLLDSGSAAVAWIDQVGAINEPERILGKAYSPTTGWTTTTEIQGPVTEAGLPRLARGAGNDLYAIWFSSDEGPEDFVHAYELRCSRSRDGGITWEAPRVVLTPEDVARVIGADNHVRLSGAFNPEGSGSGFVQVPFVVTIDQLTDRPRKPLLMALTRYPQSGWGAPEIISRQLPDTFVHGGRVRSDQQGNAVAVWEQTRQGSFDADVWVNQFILPLSRNIAPVVDAGADATVFEGDALKLDATRSTDPDGSVYRYKWSQIEGPIVNIDDPTSPIVNIDAVPAVDSDTTLKFKLEVTDNRNLTSDDVLSVKIHNLSIAEDKVEPVVTAPRAVSVSATAVLTPVDLDYYDQAAAYDNADGQLLVVPKPSGPFPLGETTVTWTAVDSAGNIGHATQKVTVYDSQVPTLTIPDDVSIESSIPVAVNIGAATANDIFGPVAITNNAPEVFPLGRTEVLWTATDRNGNSRSAVQYVSVAPNTWGEPILIEFDAVPAGPPSLDTDSSGDAVAVWLEDDGTSYSVMANRYSPGDGGWNAAEMIAAIPQGEISSVSDPKVASYGQDAAIAVWYQVNSPERRVMFSRLDPDTGWTESGQAFEGTYTDLSVSGATGSVVMAAKQYPSRNLVVSRYTEAEGWSDWFVVDSDVLVRGFNIDVSDTGQAAIVWSVRSDLKLRCLEPSKGWSAVASPVGAYGEYPKASIDDEGTVFIAWDQKVSSYRYEPYATVFRPATGFEDVTRLDSRSYEIGDVSSATNGGMAVAAWNNREIYSSVYVSEPGWSDGQQADFFRSGSDSDISLGVDGSGSTLAAWRHNTGGGIFANRFVPGVGWAYPEELAMDTGSLGNHPVLAVPSDGHALVAWQQKDLDGVESIWANRLLDTSIPNQRPVAEAGEDGKTIPGAGVSLDGSGSTDPDGSVLNAQWSQVSGPTVNISEPDALVAGFTTPAAQPGTQLVFQLLVTDARGATDTDIVTITVTNPDLVAPAVHAPPDLVVEATATLTTVELGQATAFDDVDGQLPAAANDLGPFPLGEHEIIWSATDSSGNTGTARQVVTVRDTTPPLIATPQDVAVVARYASGLDIGTASASDIFGPVAIRNDAPDEFPMGETSVTWTATDASGNVSTAIQSVRLEPEITLSIATPVTGLETTAGSVLVSGTVIAPPNTGVVVNGHAAYVDRTHTPATFNASVPLHLGENSIVAIATHVSGESTARAVDVLRTEVATSSFIVSASPVSGVSPLEVAFSPRLQSTDDSAVPDPPIYVVDYDFDGDGTTDLSKSSFTSTDGSIVFEPVDLTESVAHVYDTPGTYLAKVTINDLHTLDPNLDATGESFTMIIEVADRSQLDEMFRDIWQDMLNSLADGDVESALSHFSLSARPKYERAFTALMPNIDKVIPNLGELVQGELIGNDLAVYIARRGDEGFPIQFVRGFDGVWRISEM